MNISTDKTIQNQHIASANNTVDYDHFHVKEKRMGARCRTVALMAVVSDGKFKYHFCLVDELSLDGIRLSKIPADFDEKNGKNRAVVLAPSSEIQISIRPCWVQTTTRGLYKTVGYQIYTPSTDWQKFVKELEEDKQFSFLLSSCRFGGTT